MRLARANRTSTVPALAATLLSLLLGACATGPSTLDDDKARWAGRPLGQPPARNPTLKRTMIARATREWDYFGRQTVVYRGNEESIPHVGYWEDDDSSRSRRVNTYWRAVGQPRLDGRDCKQPWSAAFTSWVMLNSGVPRSQFKPATAHWVYISQVVNEAHYPGRWFVPRRVADYSPEPGDLICSSRGPRRPRTINGYTSSRMLRNTNTHCDLVVAKQGKQLEAIGGNVRNSVSKVSLELDGAGRLRSVPRRPWFIVLQNRL